MAEARDFARIVLLAAVVAFGPITTDLYLPSLPSMKAALAADTAAVQLTLSVYLVGFACAQLVIGPLSDRFGRRPVLLSGIGLYVLASIACALAPGIASLVALRFLQALGACSGAVLGRAIVRDLYGRERAARVLAYMGTVMALAPALAPFLGGILEVAFGWRSNFVAMAALGIAVGVAVFARLAESNPHPDAEALRPGRLAGNYLRLLGNGAYRAYVAIVAASFAGLFAWISGAAFVLIETFGVAPDRFGFYFLWCVAGYMVGSFGSGRLTLRVGLDRMILAGALVQAAAGLLLLGATLGGIGGIYGVVGPVTLYLAGCGLTLPNGLAAAVGPFPRMAGAASALLGFSQMAAGALAGYLVGRLYDGTGRSLALVVAAAGAASLLAFALSRRDRAREAAGAAGRGGPRP
ncbi:MAG: multidrug effflux MFS transporter [Proteobacteria bacterium]|nr:multidrug effflux MFS transporter [Pseudomonadota bacterium]